MKSLRLVATDPLPEPPYPANTRAKGFKFDLDMEQIRASDTWALARAEQRPWLLMLWASSWEQIPCGSFADDDEIIAARIGMDPEQFKMWRKVLLRNWVRHTDGRLYHSEITKLVQEMIAFRRKQSERKQAFREQKAKERRALESVGVPLVSHGTDIGLPVESSGCDDTTSTSTSTLTTTSTALSGSAAPKPDVTDPKQWDFTQPPAAGTEAHFVLAFLNKVSRSRYRAGEANIDLIRQRLKEATVDEIKAVIARQAGQWIGDERMEEYMRPKTLFNRTNFSNYLGKIS